MKCATTVLLLFFIYIYSSVPSNYLHAILLCVCVCIKGRVDLLKSPKDRTLVSLSPLRVFAFATAAETFWTVNQFHRQCLPSRLLVASAHRRPRQRRSLFHDDTKGKRRLRRSGFQMKNVTATNELTSSRASSCTLSRRVCDDRRPATVILRACSRSAFDRIRWNAVHKPRGKLLVFS